MPVEALVDDQSTRFQELAPTGSTSIAVLRHPTTSYPTIERNAGIQTSQIPC